MRLFTLLSCLHYVCVRLIFFLYARTHLARAHSGHNSDHRIALDLPKKKIVVVCVFLLLSFGVSYLIFSILLRRSSVLYRSGLNENVLREFHLHLNVLIFVLWVLFVIPTFFSLLPVQHSLCHFVVYLKRDEGYDCGKCVRPCLNVNRIQLRTHATHIEVLPKTFLIKIIIRRNDFILLCRKVQRIEEFGKLKKSTVSNQHSSIIFHGFICA